MNGRWWMGLAAGLLVTSLLGCETAPPRRMYARPAPPPPSVPALADIKSLAKAGVSDEVIISQIRNAHAAYRLSTAEVLDLKAAGVSDKVIDFMINTPTLYQRQVPPPY